MKNRRQYELITHRRLLRLDRTGDGKVDSSVMKIGQGVRDSVNAWGYGNDFTDKDFTNGAMVSGAVLTDLYVNNSNLLVVKFANGQQAAGAALRVGIQDAPAAQYNLSWIGGNSRYESANESELRTWMEANKGQWKGVQLNPAVPIEEGSPTLATFTFTSGQTGSTVGFSDASFYGDLDPKTYLDKTIFFIIATIAGADHIRLGTTTTDRFTNGGTPVDDLTMTIEGAPEASYPLTWQAGSSDYRDTNAARAAALRTYLAGAVGTPLELTLDVV